MRANLKLAGLGLTCFLILLIAMFPARAGFALFSPDSVDGFGISGSLWNGNAKIINIGGQQLRNTEWNIALSQLLLGRLGGDFKTHWNNGFAEGFGTISFAGTIRLSETRAGFDAAMLQSAVGTPAIAGQISLLISTLELNDNWPNQLIGRAEVLNLSSPLMGRGEAAQIGNFALEFDSTTESEAGILTGTISDTGGPLELNGSLLLAAPGSYTLKTRLKARPDAPEAMQNNLEFLGSPMADGKRIFELAGTL
jgi:general secretion pathway protein N